MHLQFNSHLTFQILLNIMLCMVAGRLLLFTSNEIRHKIVVDIMSYCQLSNRIFKSIYWLFLYSIELHSISAVSLTMHITREYLWLFSQPTAKVEKKLPGIFLLILKLYHSWRHFFLFLIKSLFHTLYRMFVTML